MSKPQLTDYEHMTCDGCNKSVRVKQDTKRGLVLQCECDRERSIRVRRAIPFEWSNG